MRVKKCRGECEAIKPVEDFYKRGNGYRSKCKDCNKKESKKHYYKDHDKTKESKRKTWHKMQLKQVLKERGL